MHSCAACWIMPEQSVLYSSVRSLAIICWKLAHNIPLPQFRKRAVAWASIIDRANKHCMRLPILEGRGEGREWRAPGTWYELENRQIMESMWSAGAFYSMRTIEAIKLNGTWAKKTAAHEQLDKAAHRMHSRWKIRISYRITCMCRSRFSIRTDEIQTPYAHDSDNFITRLNSTQ